MENHNTSVLVYKKLTRNCAEQWVFGEQWASKQSSQKCERWLLCKWSENGRFLAIYLRGGKFGRPWLSQMFKTLSMEKCGLARVTHSNTRPHFTVQSAKQKFLVTEQASNWKCNFVFWNVMSLSTKINIIKRFNLFHEIFHWENERTRQMVDQEDKFILSEKVCENNNQERKSWPCLGQICSRCLILFSHFFVILLVIIDWLFFWRIRLSSFWDESTVWVKILFSAAGYIFLTKTMNKLISTKNLRLFIVGGSVRRRSRNLFTIGSNLECFNQNLTKFIFLSTRAASSRCYAKIKR